MIRHLYIKNFILIDELSLDFDGGFSAFTGETGAGKSILIDAISLLSADRASSSMVSFGAEKAIVEGTFDISDDTHAKAVLEESGFDQADEIICTREITSGGRSTVRLNHRVITLSLLKDCLLNQIDIHGQRDNAYLLNTASHIDLLDEYLHLGDLREKVRQSWRAYRDLVNERDKALRETYDENDAEFFRHQISEIENASLKPGEDEELLTKEKRYKAIKNSYDRLNQIVSLYDDEISGSLYDLNRSIQSLSEDLNLENAKTSFTDGYYAVADAMDEVRRAFDEMDLSEDDINEMESRLYLIQRLKHKYGRTISDILQRKEELEEQIERISHREEYLSSINRQIDRAFAEYEKLAKEISGKRHDGCYDLDVLIASQLKDLILPNAVFETGITDCEPGEKGMDRVEFLISMNPGEMPKSLSKTASGGELSRLMLGLKVIFTSLQGIKTVIFDEIDTGVSGQVASAIGRKMHSLSESCQVFSVTHLAPVAACADRNYLVRKDQGDDHTSTTVTLLSEEETIDELALISSGSLTPASRAAAAELLRRSRS